MKTKKIEVEFETANPLRARPSKEFRFPPGYGDNRIVLLVRDPWWVFAYWEIRRDKEDEALRKIEASGQKAKKSILRVYDVTDVTFNGKNAHQHFDIELKGLATNWYINVSSPGRSWLVDIGILSTRDEFYVLARSNVVRTPRFGMSDKFDEEWMMPEEEYWKMFGLSGGFGIGKGSLEVREMMKRRLEEQITSAAISSLSSPVGRKRERQFWFVLNTELIVYGATEPDAKVTVQGLSLIHI